MATKTTRISKLRIDNTAKVITGYSPSASEDIANKGYVDTKQSLISSPTNNNIVTTNGSGQTQDSGKAFSTDGTFASNSDDKISTEKAVKTYVDTTVATAVTGLYDDRGNYDASGDVYPSSGGSGTAGAILKGDIWTVSVAGTLNSIDVEVGDLVRALTDSPGQTASNWAVTQNNIGYVTENSANKTDDVAGNSASSTKYASTKGVVDYITANQGQYTISNTILYSDTVVTIGNVKANYIIDKVELITKTSIDVSATLKVGITGTDDAILATSDIPNLQSFTTNDGMVMNFKIVDSSGGNLTYGVDKSVIATITQTGASAGEFILRVYLVKA